MLFIVALRIFFNYFANKQYCRRVEKKCLQMKSYFQKPVFMSTLFIHNDLVNCRPKMGPDSSIKKAAVFPFFFQL